MFAEGKLLDFFKFFDSKKPQHVEGIRRLERSLREKAPELLDDKAYWVQGWRTEPAHPPLNPGADLVLPVPYFPQYDSAIPGQASRMCFSSTCAMLLAFLRPGVLVGSGQPDDLYLRRVLQYGDTTDAQAQLRALASYGVKASFRADCDWGDVDALLDQGTPVPIGILHHGTAAAPSGGGHWILVIGRTADRSAYIVNDPAGELDLVAGGYHGQPAGRALRYSRTNLGRRWMVEGPGSGWAVLAERP